MFVETQRTIDPSEGSSILTGRTRSGIHINQEPNFPTELSSLAEEAIENVDDVTGVVDRRPRVEKDVWQHMIDCCTRFTQVRILPSRDSITLLNSLHGMWIPPYGPPKVIITDKEG